VAANALRTGEDLAWIARSYDQVHRMRTETGQRIVAATQHARGGGEAEPPGDVLRQVQRYRSAGPVPVLGRLYQRLYKQEKEIFADLGSCLEEHPAWGWLGKVRGVGPLVAAKLLSLLDVRAAPSASAFWERCGLATIAATEYSCGVCGMRSLFPRDRHIVGKHSRPDTQRACPGLLKPMDQASPVRIAQQRSVRTGASADAVEAKKICYLIGTSFLRAGSTYASYYARERAILERDRPTWPDARKDLTAMRKMEKLFLTHLWTIWRESEGLLATTQSHEADGDCFADPWRMVEDLPVIQKVD